MIKSWIEKPLKKKSWIEKEELHKFTRTESGSVPIADSPQEIEHYHDVMDGGSEPEVGNSAPESDKPLLPLPPEPEVQA